MQQRRVRWGGKRGKRERMHEKKKKKEREHERNREKKNRKRKPIATAIKTKENGIDIGYHPVQLPICFLPRKPGTVSSSDVQPMQDQTR